MAASSTAPTVDFLTRPRTFIRPDRLLSLDVLRGGTIAGMILVTDPGTYSHVFPQLLHSQWNGPTATDIIFPSFLLTVGVSLVVSFMARVTSGASYGALAAHVLRRSLWLVLLGLVVNGFPFYDLHHLRLPGILQHIALSYAPAALLFLALLRANISRARRLAILFAVAVSALALYWALLMLYPTPGFGAGRLDSLGSLPAVVDRAVFTVPHLWAYGTTPGHGVTFDPDGLLITIPSFATVVFGVLAGEVLCNRQRRLRQCATLAIAGTALWLLGLGLSHWLVLNKKIWTSTFAMFSSGLSLLVFAGLIYLIEIRGWRRGWLIARIFGTNAILAFVLSQLITSLGVVIRTRFHGAAVALHTLVYQQVFAISRAPRTGSLLYAIAIVLLNAALIYPLYRRRIFLRL